MLNAPRCRLLCLILSMAFTVDGFAAEEQLDLTRASIVVSGADDAPAAEKIAPAILQEEVEKRSKSKWPVRQVVDRSALPKIYLASKARLPAWSASIPEELLTDAVLAKPEGFCIHAQNNAVWIIGSDARGVMFGVGQLLRQLTILEGKVTLPSNYHLASGPEKQIRGHQIGYRPRANSWDAWTVEQYEQYFRDMVVFGANCMENIPFQDDDPRPLMKYPREQMNLEFARLCMKYDLDHWLWVPVEFSVADDLQKGEEFLQRQSAFYAACPRLDAIFVPGGDPGHNPSAKLLPYLEKMARTAQQHHPKAKIWLSLQGFKGRDIDDFYDYLNQQKPDWFGGAVMGPSSPPMEATRARLPRQYPLRWYPDITHIVRCQYPVPWLDPAWGLTIGREGVNPRPQDYAAIYQNDYRLTDGFLSYTDGINDDFNKNLWTAMAWDSKRSIREITAEYARYFFRSDLDTLGTDALFGLEANLRGPAATNGSVSGTLALWQKMESQLPLAERNWRFDMHLFRAYYDAYIQSRLNHESQLEATALNQLSEAKRAGVEVAIKNARATLKLANTPVRPDLHTKIHQLADRLFETISYQTSVPKYGGSGYERGCMMDYLDYPLNNRWWIEAELEEIQMLSDQPEQLARLQAVVDWENPGPGGYYEALGHVGKSLHMVKLLNGGDAMRHYRDLPMPTQRNIGPDRNRLRLSFHVYHDDIPTLKYNGLDPQGKYMIRLYAQRESPLEIDGVLAKRIRTGRQFDQVSEQEFEVPSSAVEDGILELSWAELDQSHLNWRQKHYVTDLWIIKQP